MINVYGLEGRGLFRRSFCDCDCDCNSLGRRDGLTLIIISFTPNKYGENFRYNSQLGATVKYKKRHFTAYYK
jgi:hypothetical protein